MALTKIDDRGLKTPIDLLDNEKIRLGTGNDLQIYTSGSNSVITHNGDGNLQLTTGASGEDILLQAYGDIDLKPNNGNNGVKIIGGGAVSLYYDNSKKFETTANGVKVPDNQYSYWGDGNDLWIGHNGSNSYIDNNVGHLYIASDHLDLTRGDRNENFITCTEGGTVELYYDGNRQLYTTATGVIVGDADHTDSVLRIDHEDNTGKGRLEVNAFGTASVQLLSNFSGSASNGVPDGAFGLTTPHSKDIHICTNGTSRMMIGSSGQLGLSGANYGTSGQVLTSQGASSAPQWADAGGGGITGMVVLTSGSSASWSIPSGVSTIKVICTGGGGGATGPTNPPGDESSGGAGGGGGTAIRYYDVSGGGTATYTVGAGGTGHTNTGSAGNGGDSTFAYGGTTITGGGGVGGTASDGIGGTGGTASGGTLNLPGCGGEGGARASIGQGVANAQGGASYWGAGVGRGRRQTANNSTSDGVDGAANTGAGGTAAHHNDRTGGAGGSGVIVIEY